jgi:peptide/nickel transport system permease protein
MLHAPSLLHPLGTDDFGRDVFTRTLYGGQLSLAVSLVSAALVIARPVGVLANYVGGAADEILMRLIDSLAALSALVLALTIATVLGPVMAGVAPVPMDNHLLEDKMNFRMA